MGTHGRPWRDFFDAKAMQAEIDVMEYEDFYRISGVGTSVEMATLLSVAGPGGAKNKNAFGDFLGWTQPGGPGCSGGEVRMPQMSKKGSQVNIVFSGYCDRDIVVKEFQCAPLKQASQRGVLDMLHVATSKRNTKTFLLKHLDSLNLHSAVGPVARRLQTLLRPAASLRTVADDFIQGTLGEPAYLAVHLRRNEFVKHHPSSTPSVEAAAVRLNRLLKSLHLEQVFVATDANDEFRIALRQRVKAPLYYFAPDDGAKLPDHKGHEDIIVLRVLARAKHFIGSAQSAYSKMVKRERHHLGHKADSSEVFCEGLTVATGDERCSR